MRPDGFDQHWSHSYIGYKVPVHDIEVQEIRACVFDSGDLLIKFAEVGGEERWRHGYFILRDIENGSHYFCTSCCFAHESLRVTVRLNTILSAELSGSTQK